LATFKSGICDDKAASQVGRVSFTRRHFNDFIYLADCHQSLTLIVHFNCIPNAMNLVTAEQLSCCHRLAFGITEN